MICAWRSKAAVGHNAMMMAAVATALKTMVTHWW